MKFIQAKTIVQNVLDCTEYPDRMTPLELRHALETSRLMLKTIADSDADELTAERALEVMNTVRDAIFGLSKQQFRNALKHSIGAGPEYADGYWVQFQDAPMHYLCSRNPPEQALEILRVCLNRTKMLHRTPDQNRATMEAVVSILLTRGYKATLEYPGYVDVVLADHEGVTLAFGDSDETWGGNFSDAEGHDLTAFVTELSIDEEQEPGDLADIIEDEINVFGQ